MQKDLRLVSLIDHILFNLGYKAESIKKIYRNENLPEYMEVKWDVHFKNKKDAVAFANAADTELSNRGISSGMEMDDVTVLTGTNDYVAVLFLSWEMDMEEVLPTMDSIIGKNKDIVGVGTKEGDTEVFYNNMGSVTRLVAGKVGKVVNGVTSLDQILSIIGKRGYGLISDGTDYIVVQIDEDNYEKTDGFGGWDEKYIEYINDRDDLDDRKKEQVLDCVTGSDMYLKDYLSNTIAQDLYDNVIDTEYTGDMCFVMKYDISNSRLFLLKMIV